MTNQLGKIQHVVHLMLENRAFDHMLGFLYADTGNVSPGGQPFDGLTGAESNPDDAGLPVKVFRIQAGDADPYRRPGADPGEGFQNANLQLFSTAAPAPDAVPTNQGFVVNFKAAIAYDIAHHYADTLPTVQASDIMGMYTPELLPVLSGLAKGFAVCDRWFASAPTETLPNRAFALAGTSQGHMDNHVKVFTCPSIFGRLADKGLDWTIYGYNRAPLTKLDFPDTQNAAHAHFGRFSDFRRRAAAGTLAAYSFLEPAWSAGGNSQHPNYNVAAGEALILAVYEALRHGPGWASTLLIITYDEHGGTYDHVPPPSGATPPGDGTVGEFGFDFTRLGVRVPAVLVSPLIAAGTVYRGEGLMDHTSVLKTLHERFGTAPLTRRDQAAASLGDVLTLSAPRSDDPLHGVVAPAAHAAPPVSTAPSRTELRHAAQVAALPIPNADGFYEQASTAGLTTSAAVGDFIQARTAAWEQSRSGQGAAGARPQGSAESELRVSAEAGTLVFRRRLFQP